MYLGPKFFGIHSGFWLSECKLVENIFGVRKIFVSWRAKHEATYIVNTKTYDTNVDSHVLLDCSQQVTAKCSTSVRSILMILAKYITSKQFWRPLISICAPIQGGHGPLGPPATTPLVTPIALSVPILNCWGLLGDNFSVLS